MRPNRVKQRIRDGEIAWGGYVNLADPAVVEIIGLAGFDSAFIDMEHATFDVRTVLEMVRAADLAGITSLVRVPDTDPKFILRILEAGAQGIQVPGVQTRKQAEIAVNAVKYPPRGRRGAAGATRSARFGTVSWNDHVETSNRETLLCCMIEDERGVENLEEIASLDGVDLISVGPADLSQSLGITQPDDPKLRAAVDDISSRLKKIGNAKLSLPYGNAWLPLSVADLKRLGVGYSNVEPSDARAILLYHKNTLNKIHAEIEQLSRDGK